MSHIDCRGCNLLRTGCASREIYTTHSDLGPARRKDWSISGLRSGTTRHDKPTQAKKRRSVNPHRDTPSHTGAPALTRQNTLDLQAKHSRSHTGRTLKRHRPHLLSPKEISHAMMRFLRQCGSERENREHTCEYAIPPAVRLRTGGP